MIRIILFAIFLTLISLTGTRVYGQDVWLQNHFSPSSGCSLSSAEIVNVLINNNSGGVMASNSINVKYTVDNGAVTQQLLNSNLLPGASWSFTFNVNANLSACGPHVMKVWVTRAGDVNHLNDTIQWTVQNDCPVVPGTVSSSSTVCSGINSGTLNLTGWTYGTINDWEYSTDSGATWTGAGINTISYNYLNVPATTVYQVVIDGGFCPDDTSQVATLTVQPVPTAGTLTGSDSLCVDNASGTLLLTGTSSPVTSWQYSTDNGSTWTSDPTTTTSFAYTNLNQTTIFRAISNDGVCPAMYSDTAEIFVNPLSAAGVLTGNQNLCSGETYLMSLSGYGGAIQQWESSSDGLTWTPIAVTTSTYDSGSLTDTTSYRVIVQNGICPADTSNTAVLSVSSIVPGTIVDSDSLCISNASGSLELTGASHAVAFWETSVNNGVSWTAVPANTTTTLPFSGLTQTTWYRVFTDNGICSSYSDTAVIFVQALSNAGTLADNDTLCKGETTVMSLSGHSGAILGWEYTSDGITWIPISTTLPVYTSAALTDTTDFRVIVKNGICPADTSNAVTIIVNPLPVADAGPDVTITSGESTILDGSGGFTGVWTPGATLTDSIIPNPVATPLVTTTYTYYVISQEGCFNSDDMTVQVDPAIDSTAFDIKNVITANNDGFNDAWIIEGILSYPQTFVVIYNVYGKELYSSNDYMNDWEGTYEGSRLPNGTYYYTVIPGGTEQEFKGTLTILGDE